MASARLTATSPLQMHDRPIRNAAHIPAKSISKLSAIRAVRLDKAAASAAPNAPNKINLAKISHASATSDSDIAPRHPRSFTDGSDTPAMNTG